VPPAAPSGPLESAGSGPPAGQPAAAAAEAAALAAAAAPSAADAADASARASWARRTPTVRRLGPARDNQSPPGPLPAALAAGRRSAAWRRYGPARAVWGGSGTGRRMSGKLESLLRALPIAV
jgi:hypothetical protein